MAFSLASFFRLPWVDINMKEYHMLIVGLTAARICPALRTWSIELMPSGLDSSLSLGEDMAAVKLGLVKAAGDNLGDGM
jgi:hypothetical protein